MGQGANYNKLRTIWVFCFFPADSSATLGRIGKNLRKGKKSKQMFVIKIDYIHTYYVVIVVPKSALFELFKSTSITSLNTNVYQLLFLDLLTVQFLLRIYRVFYSFTVIKFPTRMVKNNIIIHFITK